MIGDMKTIRKYDLKATQTQTLCIPRGGTILDIQAINDNTPQMWVLVDPTMTDQERTLVVYATGTELPDDPGTYCGTFLLYGGTLEFHAFEQEPDE